MFQHRTIEDTVYFWFGANDTSGSGADGASPVYDVRLAGAAAGAIPVLSGSGTLLTHASFPDGCHEVAVAATTGNGFAAGSTYAVFCTLLVDSQNPTGFVGSFILKPIIANVQQWLGTAVNEDTAGYPVATVKDGTGTGEINTNSGKIVEVETLSNHTAQSGDGYAVVNSGTFGNSKLVRATTPGNTLDVAATGEAGIDFSNTKGTHPTVPLVTDITNKVGFSLSTAGILAIWHQATSAIVTAGTVGIKLKNWALGTDNKALISTDAQDLSGTLAVNTKTFESTLDLTSTMKASVNSEVDDVISTDANTELASVPTTTGTLRQQVQYIFTYFRNKKTITSTTETLLKEDASTTLGTAAVTDDGTTFTKNEMN